jgi:fibronectin-binding autotransporter adhesin
MKNTIILSIIILVSYIPSSFGQVLTISDGQVDPESTATLTNSYHDEVIFEDQGGTLNISQTGNGSYAGDIWQQNLAAGASANLEINSPGAVIQLPGLAASPPVLVPISGMVTINGGTLQGSTSPNALLNLAVSGAVYELGGDQTVSDLAGAQGSSISLGGNTLTVGYNNGVFMGTQTFAGDITGTGGVIFNGEETYILTGTNTYTGGTQINGDGTLQGTTDSLPAGGPIENNATLSIVQASSGTYTGDISGSGGVSISAAGETISFTGTNTYTGGTSLNDGTLEVINGAFPGTINVGSNLTFNQSASASFGGQIFGDGAVFITGGFPLTLTGEDPFSGVMTINNDGSTLIGNTSSIQGNVTNNSMLTFNQSGTGTYGGIINGTGAVTIAGGGALTFTGNNTYTGGTTINDDGSNLIVSAPTSTSPITPGNITGNVTNNGTLTFNQIGGATPLSYSFPGDITGTGGVAIEGSTGQFTLSLTGKNNTYSGATTLNTPVGTLQGSFPESQLSLTAGTYDLGTADHTIGSLTGTTASVVNLEANTLTMGGDNSTTTFYGTIIDAGTGAGSIVKNGSGTLTLALTPTYTGSTTINGGTLQVVDLTSLSNTRNTSLNRPVC